MNASGIVTRSTSGSLNWASKSARNTAIQEQLRREGYTINIPSERLDSKYYISRSASVVRDRIETAFKTEPQLNKYLKEWNRYSHLHDSITVIHRDDVLNRAARHILGD